MIALYKDVRSEWRGVRTGDAAIGNSQRFAVHVFSISVKPNHFKGGKDFNKTKSTLRT